MANPVQLIVVALVSLVLGLAIGAWLYRRTLKKNPEKIHALAKEIADFGVTAKAAAQLLETSAKEAIKDFKLK